jgi:hypothetical protein
MAPRTPRFHARFSLVFLTSAILALGAEAPGPAPFTLMPGDPVSADSLGQSVFINDDTAVAGAPTKVGTQGRAFVFVRSGTAWSQQANLSASDSVTGDQLGWPVSVDGDNGVLRAMGASGPAAANVFVRSGSSWTPQAKLTAARPATIR